MGGVGSYVAEALARAGVGKLVICDNDVIAPHNINRQLYALHSTVGKKKAQVAFERLKDINPNLQVVVKDCFLDGQTINEFDLSSYSYVADCIDTVTSKILLAKECLSKGVKIISCMGTGNKLNANFTVKDIKHTKVCPLARVMRRELRKRGIAHLKVVYSRETPIDPVSDEPSDPDLDPCSKRQTPGSCAFVPSAAGLILAGEIIRDLIRQ